MGLHYGVTVSQFPNMSSSSVAVTTAGTSVLIPSLASGTIYITDIFVGNGAAQGSVYFGVGTGAVAPTTSAILIQSLFIAANTTLPMQSLSTPVKVTSGNNFLVTAVSCTTAGISALYYQTV